MSSSSDSESEDERMKILKSSIDPQFANVYNSNSAESTAEIKAKTSKVSQRPTKLIYDDPYDLKTTPEFRQHVAKKLGELIKSKIKIRKKKIECVKETENAEDFGIRLFSTSKDFAHTDDEVACAANGKRSRKLKKSKSKNDKQKNTNDDSSSDSDDAEEYKRLSSVAVSADWVYKVQAPYQIKTLSSSNTCTTVNNASEITENIISHKKLKKKHKINN